VADEKKHGFDVVLCWYCEQEVSKRKTIALPNGARVCRKHKCSLCGDFIPPSQAFVLRIPAMEGAGAATEYLCKAHRRYAVERKNRDSALIMPGDTKW